jgi:hypothetical protein
MKTIASLNGLRSGSLAALLAAWAFQASSALAVEPGAAQRTDSNSRCCQLVVGESALHLPGLANSRGRSTEGTRPGYRLVAWPFPWDKPLTDRNQRRVTSTAPIGSS